ncbi:MAG: S8 family serine peptidase, partial [Candidatus Obscuribacterales bacterium]|nr:S8 family serine peptidase [Candidatus Obscuribacterales bacterium]
MNSFKKPNKKPNAIKAAVIACLALLLGFTVATRTGNVQDLSTTKNSTQPFSGQIIPGQYIVTLKDGVNPATLIGPHTLIGGQQGLSEDQVRIYKYALNGFATGLSANQAISLENDPRVEAVEPDRVIMLDKESMTATNVKAWVTGEEELPPGISRIEADKSSSFTKDNSNINLAIIDAGVTDHEDENVVYHKNHSGKEGKHAHGTHVAGTAGAKKNGKYVIGVCPGVAIWDEQALDARGSGSLSGVVAAIDDVTAHSKAKVKPGEKYIHAANMSLGGEFQSDALDKSITNSVEAGVTYIVAAGNSNKDAAKFSPANHPKVICVSAMADYDGVGGGKGTATCRDDADDSRASFSNYGSLITIAAPGVCINSCMPGNQTGVMSGTSMAS